MKGNGQTMNLKILKTFIGIIIAFVAICTVLVFSPEKESIQTFELESPESSWNQKENVQSRQEYEQQMIINPQTGKVPTNIRHEELDYLKELNRQNRLRETPNSKSGKSLTAANEENVWTSIGPQNIAGRTRAVALDVLDERIILAGGVSGGIWRTDNQGLSWTKTTSPDQIQSVTAITQDLRPGRENIWYYGTGELVGNSGRAPGAPFRGDGIFKSTDGGHSWSPLPSTQSNTPGSFSSPFQYVWDITTNPKVVGQEILAAVYGGIVRSVDGGQTWTTVLGTDLLNVNPGTDLNDVNSIFYTDIHRTSDGTFYASLSAETNAPNVYSPAAGVYKSTDGANWERVLSLNNTRARRTEIASCQTQPNILYFLADLGTANYGLWKYNSTTQELDNLSANVPDGVGEIEAFDSQGSYNMVVNVLPTNPDVVFIGGTNLYRSHDGFATTENTRWIGGYNPDTEDDSDLYPNHHPDQHALLFYPDVPIKMLSVNDGGIFITFNNLADQPEYFSLNNGYVTTQFYTASFSRYAPDDAAFGGTQDNGSIITFNTPVGEEANGAKIIGGDGGFTASTPFGFYYYLSFQNSQIYRVTLNSGAGITSFARVDPIGGGGDPNQPYLFVNPYVLDPNNANRMYLAGGDYIWFNQNVSQIPSGSQSQTRFNWKRLDKTEIEDGVITALQLSTIERNILYYGTSLGQLFKVTNAHTELYTVEEITGNNFPEGYIRNVAIDPTNSDHIIVTFSNYGVVSVFSSTDGGETFESISGNLEENPDGSGNGPSVRWATIVPLTTGEHEYYVGTSVGLFKTTTLNGDQTVWTQEAPDQIGNVIVNMIDYRQSDGKMVIATHGQGLYTTQIANVVQNENLVPAEEFEITDVYPNPFRDELLIRVKMPETAYILIRIYDTAGNEIRSMSSNLGFVGENDFFWDGNDAKGQPVQNGVYIVRVNYKYDSKVLKVILER